MGIQTGTFPTDVVVVVVLFRSWLVGDDRTALTLPSLVINTAKHL